MKRTALIAAAIMASTFLVAFGASLWASQGEAYYVSTIVTGLPHCF